jgi:hypothetical protein
VGDSNSSRTDGFNTIEYNLFEGLTQAEPEIISNKSDFNTYRFNTFKNCQGGLTLRHGRYCNVYSNSFIVDDPAVTQSYGIRAIDKGHKIFNNYIEAVNGNASGGTSQLRAPVNLYNGLSADTTDLSAASGYFAADSCIVAFNTIVNAKGGGGIILGGTGGGTIQPKGIVVANNLIKMASGTAVYLNPSNTSLTYMAEGNIYQAPSGLGLSTSAGFTNATLSFGTRTNGILLPPSLVTDAAVNTISYLPLLNNMDAQSQLRSVVYDVGADEINGSGSILQYPLDSNLVGAGKPVFIMPVHLISFNVVFVNDKVQLSWQVENEIDFSRYEVELSGDGRNFQTIGTVSADARSNYNFIHINSRSGKSYYRLKLVDKDGSFTYSATRILIIGERTAVNIYPNPANDFVHVEFSGGVLPVTNIILFDASGKQVSKILEVNSKVIVISVQRLPAGLYRLQVIRKGRTVSNYPLIINR